MIALLVVPGVMSKLIRETQVEKMKMVWSFFFTYVLSRKLTLSQSDARVGTISEGGSFPFPPIKSILKTVL